jgi:LysR family transcriptional regulator, chromosome initiation inhibitor
MDYEALKTLEAVIRNQNFERAAQELFVTQSAVSQRVNQLEVEHGQRLLIRELPYRPTELGEKILSHYRKVLSLEQSLDLSSEKPSTEKVILKISMNVDSLETWFMKVLQDTEIAKMVHLQITVDDEKYTLNYLKSGRVDLSIGTMKTPVSNHDCIKLGSMTYAMVASPEFKKKYFPKNMSVTDFSQIPAIIFNDRDDLQTAYLKKHFQYSGSYPSTSIPSFNGFKEAILSGYGYGLQSVMEIKKELKARTLVLVAPDKTFERDLYLHHWNYQTATLKSLIAAIQNAAKSID